MKIGYARDPKNVGQFLIRVELPTHVEPPKVGQIVAARTFEGRVNTERLGERVGGYDMGKERRCVLMFRKGKV